LRIDDFSWMTLGALYYLAALTFNYKMTLVSFLNIEGALV